MLKAHNGRASSFRRLVKRPEEAAVKTHDVFAQKLQLRLVRTP